MKLLLLLLVLANAQANECRFAAVTYEHPTSYATLPEDGKTTTTTNSIGCVEINETTVTVIHTLSNGKAQDILAIPLGSVTNITYLKEVKDETVPQLLPEHTTKSCLWAMFLLRRRL